MRIDRNRNFSIIAHVDHGKSTLADRLLEKTKAVQPREFREQMLDDMDLERERGITIKAKAVSLNYQWGSEELQFNLIDTPGHVDFSYEVSRSLAACEGAILVVDAVQGVQAQTIANAYLAIENNLEIIPVINKIDLPHADPKRVAEEMNNSLGIRSDEIICVSAKFGTGIDELLDAIARRIPPPKGEAKRPLRALIFDAEYDEYRGVIVYVRLVDGRIARGDKIAMMRTGKTYEVQEVGKFRPRMTRMEELSAGEVGFIIANIRSIRDVKVGDTVRRIDEPLTEILPGYREPVPMVFSGFYPAMKSDFQSLQRALERLNLNDSAFKYEPESSPALGLGFRCGFLGLLHMEIVQERIYRESNVDVVQTAPNVTYQVVDLSGNIIMVDNPAKIPPAHERREIREPVMRVSLIVPADSIGAVMKLCENARGRFHKSEYISQSRVILVWDIPFADMLYDFYDRLKSVTRGYGTMDYEFLGYEAADLVKLRILVAGEEVDSLSTIVHRSQAERRGRKIIKVLKKKIPRHLFQVALQAAVENRIVARENISALAKHVTGKCYGGDITRKRKLWEKQKEGKKRLKMVGKVTIPQEAFLAVLTPDQD